jgi:cobalt-zinc-cadmium efflux system membrane fusion protein
MAIVAVIAGVVGFALARWTTPVPPGAPEATAKALPDSVEVGPEGISAVGIAIERVAAGNLRDTILTTAKVRPKIRGQAVVMAQIAGSVGRISGRVGDNVQAGDVLAIIEGADAARLLANRTTARSRLVAARAALAREKELYLKQVTSRESLERAQTEFDAAEADAQAADTAAAMSRIAERGTGAAVVSPIGGKIVSRTAALGQFVLADTELFRVTDPQAVEIEAALPQTEARRVVAGDPARMRMRDGTLVEAAVRSNTAVLDDETRAATVLMDPVPGQPQLTPGDVLMAEILPKSTAADGVVVPEDAVQSVDGRDVVFVRTEKGFTLRPVIVGARSGGRAAIVSGLKAGEAIATTNAFFIKAELRKPTGED